MKVLCLKGCSGKLLQYGKDGCGTEKPQNFKYYFPAIIIMALANAFILADSKDSILIHTNV